MRCKDCCAIAPIECYSKTSVPPLKGAVKPEPLFFSPHRVIEDMACKSVRWGKKRGEKNLSSTHTLFSTCWPICSSFSKKKRKKKTQHGAIRHEYEAIGLTMFRRSLGAWLGLLPTLWWVGSIFFNIHLLCGVGGWVHIFLFIVKLSLIKYEVCEIFDGYLVGSFNFHLIHQWSQSMCVSIQSYALQ